MVLGLLLLLLALIYCWIAWLLVEARVRGNVRNFPIGKSFPAGLG